MSQRKFFVNLPRSPLRWSFPHPVTNSGPGLASRRLRLPASEHPSIDRGWWWTWTRTSAYRKNDKKQPTLKFFCQTCASCRSRLSSLPRRGWQSRPAPACPTTVSKSKPILYMAAHPGKRFCSPPTYARSSCASKCCPPAAFVTSTLSWAIEVSVDLGTGSKMTPLSGQSSPDRRLLRDGLLFFLLDTDTPVLEKRTADQLYMFEGKVYSGVATPVTYDDPFPLRLCEAQEKSLPDNQPKKTRKNVLIYIYQ